MPFELPHGFGVPHPGARARSLSFAVFETALLGDGAIILPQYVLIAVHEALLGVGVHFQALGLRQVSPDIFVVQVGDGVAASGPCRPCRGRLYPCPWGRRRRPWPIGPCRPFSCCPYPWVRCRPPWPGRLFSFPWDRCPPWLDRPSSCRCRLYLWGCRRRGLCCSSDCWHPWVLCCFWDRCSPWGCRRSGNFRRSGISAALGIAAFLTALAGRGAGPPPPP